MHRMFIAALSVLLIAGFVTGCNTVDGAGRDIEGAGNWIQDTF